MSLHDVEAHGVAVFAGAAFHELPEVAVDSADAVADAGDGADADWSQCLLQ